MAFARYDNNSQTQALLDWLLNDNSFYTAIQLTKVYRSVCAQL